MRPGLLARAAYLVGRKRAQAEARREVDDLAAKFEEINEETRAELRALRQETSRVHMIDVALASERDESLWLN